MPFEKLKTCPLIETVCEFRFAPSVAWDSTMPGLLHERLKVEFPNVVDAPRRGFEVQVDPAKGPLAVKGLDSHRVQFRRADNSALIQVDDRMLSANMLAPYTGWEEGFRPIIQSGMSAIRDLRPGYQLSRIGLRYINQIPMQSAEDELGDYLTTVPKLQGTLAQHLQSSFQRFELIHAKPHGVLVHQSGLRRQGAESSIMLDLDFVTLLVSDLDTDARILDWLEGAHECVIRTFNDSLSPALYQRLKEGNQ